MIKFMKSIKNKVSVSLILIILFSFNKGFASPDIQIIESKYHINQYVEENKWDFLGCNGEKLYFNLRDKYADGKIIKELEFDIKMRKEIYSMGSKVLDDNAIIYGSLVALYGIKTTSTSPKGIEKTNNALFNMIKRLMSF